MATKNNNAAKPSSKAATKNTAIKPKKAATKALASLTDKHKITQLKIDELLEKRIALVAEGGFTEKELSVGLKKTEGNSTRNQLIKNLGELDLELDKEIKTKREIELKILETKEPKKYLAPRQDAKNIRNLIDGKITTKLINTAKNEIASLIDSLNLAQLSPLALWCLDMAVKEEWLRREANKPKKQRKRQPEERLEAIRTAIKPRVREMRSETLKQLLISLENSPPYGISSFEVDLVADTVDLQLSGDNSPKKQSLSAFSKIVNKLKKEL